MKRKVFFGLTVALIIILMSGQAFAAPLLRQGARGESVREVQSILQQENYSVGPVDGIFGPMTRSAVISFQRDSGILVDGIVGPQTWQALENNKGSTSRVTSSRTLSTQTGIASWYGSKFHGRTTANGEVYNMYAMTAAHKTLPFGTMVRVICLESGRRVTVRINDRGPFIDGRIIDLSMRAAEELGLKGRGIGQVRIEW